MNIAFYIDEMNLRGVANSTYLYALNNKTFLKNNSIIFYNKKNLRNRKEVIKKFTKKFITIGVSMFSEIDIYKEKYNIKFLYTQKSGNKDNWVSSKIKTLVHCAYPQKLHHVHGHNYAYVSEWLSEEFSNRKIPYISYITETKKKTNSNLRKKLKIDKNKIIFGCHGGESSFDMRFTHAAILKTVQKSKNIIFLFLNINKFCKHPQIKFLKGTANEDYKKKFINTCDAMIYGRSLGESFGLACAEFALMNKDIISYQYNRHRAHKYNSSSENFMEYNSYSSLCKILLNYKKKSSKFSYDCKYKNYTKIRVMKDFSKFFLSKKNINHISTIDYLINIINITKMNYFYVRHKIYNHFFNFFESKFFI
jgi:hypothetical protein